MSQIGIIFSALISNVKYAFQWGFWISILCVIITKCREKLFMKDVSMKSVQSVHAVDNQKKPILPKHLSKAPAVAIPTVMLAIINFILWIIVQNLYSYKYLSYSICLPIWVIQVYVAFTPLHDASHFSLATRKSGYRFLNGFIGRLCGLMFCSAFPLFRYVHLQHHKYTNIPSHDPDFWSVSGPVFILPFKWFCQIFKYFYVYLCNLRTQPYIEIFEVLLMMIGPDIIAEYCYPFQIFYRFQFPTIIAAAFLVFVFDYIPHRSHKNDDLFIGTNVTSLYGDINQYKLDKDKMITPLTIPLLWQNYHNIHHLYPWLPFYTYSKVWYEFDELLLKKGTPIRSFLPIF